VRVVSSTKFIAFGLLYSIVNYALFGDIDVSMALYAAMIGIVARGGALPNSRRKAAK
jgi:hypothetical protein